MEPVGVYVLYFYLSFFRVSWKSLSNNHWYTTVYDPEDEDAPPRQSVFYPADPSFDPKCLEILTINPTRLKRIQPILIESSTFFYCFQ